MTAGTIASIDGDEIVVTTEDGESVTATTSADTTVTVTGEIRLDDLAVDDEITVSGTTDDGVVTATTIRRGEAVGFGRGTGGPGGAPADAA